VFKLKGGSVVIKIDTNDKDEDSSFEELVEKVLGQLVKDGEVKVRRDAITGKDTYMRVNLNE
jgi:hypothetical protein